MILPFAIIFSSTKRSFANSDCPSGLKITASVSGFSAFVITNVDEHLSFTFAKSLVKNPAFESVCAFASAKIPKSATASSKVSAPMYATIPSATAVLSAKLNAADAINDTMSNAEPSAPLDPVSPFSLLSPVSPLPPVSPLSPVSPFSLLCSPKFNIGKRRKISVIE